MNLQDCGNLTGFCCWFKDACREDLFVNLYLGFFGFWSKEVWTFWYEVSPCQTCAYHLESTVPTDQSIDNIYFGCKLHSISVIATVAFLWLWCFWNNMHSSIATSWKWANRFNEINPMASCLGLLRCFNCLGEADCVLSVLRLHRPWI